MTPDQLRDHASFLERQARLVSEVDGDYHAGLADGFQTAAKFLRARADREEGHDRRDVIRV